jgi:outer membrane receptor protein involved in Fe transport
MLTKLLLTLLTVVCLVLPVAAAADSTEVEPHTKAINPDEVEAEEEEKKDKEDIGSILVEDASEAMELTHSPMPVSVIEMDKYHGRNISLNDVLKRVAGVNIRQEGGLGSRSTIAIQGLEGQRVRIYIDGNPLNAPDGTFGINDIPIQFIERIEVYKGVVPARFGGDNLGGAVNVVTREFIGDYVDLTASIGSYGTYRGAVVLKKDFLDHKYELGVGGFYNEAANDYIMKSPYVEGLDITRDHDRFRSILAAVVGQANDVWFDEVGLELIRYESEKEIQGIKSPIKAAEANSEANIAAVSFEKERFFSDRLEFEYDFAFVDLHLHLIDKADTCYNWDGTTRPCPGVGGEMDGIPNDSDDTQTEYRHDLNLHYIFSRAYALNFHLNSRFSRYEPEDDLASESLGYDIGAFPSETENHVLSLGLESFHLNRKVANDLGLKYYFYDYEITSQERSLTGDPEKTQNDGSDFGFYEAIRYEPLKGLFLKGSYEHAYRFPNSGEVFGDGVTITPSPGLEPEEADNFNLGILFERYNFLRLPWFKAETNFFYRYVENLIKLEPGVHTAGYVNMGEVEVIGIEFDVRGDLTENWFVYANYTNQSLTDQQKSLSGTDGTPNPTYGHDLPNVPKQYANFGIEFKTLGLLRSDSLFKLFWETGWVDEYYYGWELSRHQERKIEAQITHTAGFEYSFLNDSWIIGFEVRNLTDEEVTDVFNYPLPGRTYHLNLRYVWNEM